MKKMLSIVLVTLSLTTATSVNVFAMLDPNGSGMEREIGGGGGGNAVDQIIIDGYKGNGSRTTDHEPPHSGSDMGRNGCWSGAHLGPEPSLRDIIK